MPESSPRKSRKQFRLVLAVAVLAGLMIVGCYGYAKKVKHEPCTIGVILTEDEVPGGKLPMLKQLIAKKIEGINELGGINGRPVTVTYLDDHGNDKELYRLVQETSRDTNLIGYVACRGFSRAKTISPLLTSQRIAYIGQYVFTKPFQEHPTMYTATAGIKKARGVVRALIRSKGKRVAFIGEKGNGSSENFLEVLDEMVAQDRDLKMAVRRTFPKGFVFSPAQSFQLADSLKSEADMLVLVTSPGTCNSLLDLLELRKIHVPLYIAMPELSMIDRERPGYRAAEIYYINMFGIPGAQNSRWQEQVQSVAPAVSEDVIWQFSVVGRIVDEIGLICEAAQLPGSSGRVSLREKVNAGLKQYINGNRVYRGWLADWYFTPERAYAGETLIGWKPRHRETAVMAPFQYIWSDSGVVQRPVLYTNLNLDAISQVNEDEGSFYATFYLEMNSAQNLEFSSIEFSNAARNEVNHAALIDAKLIRSKKDTLGFGFYNNLFQISGKFFFEPNLKNYPLDQQVFPISIQASNPDKFFLVQPARKERRDTIFETEGWIFKNQYLGYDQDVINLTNNFYGRKNNILYYKFTYNYELKRAPIDFFLKTLVPLLAIIVITYFSVYIPPREFESLCAVQVTGLLSCIALYFSTYKPEMQYATISDKIFIFMYIMITTLIGTSILLYILHHRRSPLRQFMRIYQRYLFPVIVLGFTVYIRWF